MNHPYFIISDARIFTIDISTYGEWRISKINTLSNKDKAILDEFNINTKTWYQALPRKDLPIKTWQTLANKETIDHNINGAIFQEYLEALSLKNNSTEDRLWFDFFQRNDWRTWVEDNIRERIRQQAERSTEGIKNAI